MNGNEPICPNDLFEMSFLRDAQLSPDGRSIAYTVCHSDGERDCFTIWLIDLDTYEARPLTSGSSKDMDPQWSPDGTEIAFLRQVRNAGANDTPVDSAEEPKTQLHLITVDGGEAWSLSDLPQVVGGGPSWSPDGAYVAFSAGPAEPTNTKRPYRLTRSIFRFDGLGYLDAAAQDIFFVPSAGGQAVQLTRDACHNVEPIWSPAGDEILYLASFEPDSHHIYPALRVANLEGQVRDLTGDWGYAASAAWTPDAQRVVFVGNPYDVDQGCQAKLWAIDRDGGEPQCLCPDLDLQVGGVLQGDMPLDRLNPVVRVSADGTAAYVQVQEGGTVPIYSFSLHDDGLYERIVSGERSCILKDVRAGRLVFSVSNALAPTDLYVKSVDENDERRLTRLNDRLLARRVLPRLERLSFVSTDRVPVEGWLLKPPNGQAPYPTVLYIHGGPHSGFGQVFSFDFHMLAGAGFAVLFLNQRGSTGYGDAFSTAIIGDWGGLDYADLMAGVDHAVELGLANPERLGCCGLSGGGNLTCWIVGHTQRFKAAVPENPVTNFSSFYGCSDIGPWFASEELGGRPHEIPDVYLRCSPITYAHRCTTPTLLLQGENDYRCPAEQSEQFFAVLKASGCPVEMLRLPGASHGGAIRGEPVVRRAQNEALLRWMERYV